MATVDFQGKSKQRIRRDDEETISEKFIEMSLSRINGEINKMKKNDMIILLKENNLHIRGVKGVLSKRLKSYYKKQKMNTELEDGKQHYKFFIVIDFEATCVNSKVPNYLYEIIEFPAILIESETGKIVDEFHSYCRPSVNPKLTEFCTSLTGIHQSDVDTAPPFTIVFKNFERWMQERNLLKSGTAALISDGSWDFSRFLNIQCCLSELKYPRWAKKWINIKKIYGNFYKFNRPTISEMLSNLGLKFEGRLHCGLDDAKNLARIVSRLLEDGCVLQVNERLNAGKLETITEMERKLLCSGSSRPLATDKSTVIKTYDEVQANPDKIMSENNTEQGPELIDMCNNLKISE